MNYFKNIALLLTIGSLAACAGSPTRPHPDYAPPEWTTIEIENPVERHGAIYSSNNSMSLFGDVKASQVGDILTVVLDESMNAQKKSGTTIDKSNITDITDPLLAGNNKIIGKDNSLAFKLESEHKFSGESDSSQSNVLTGNIAVTVVEVLPRGNLRVQGEKWIKINQGNEYIRIKGIIRAADVTTTNKVLSTQIADARVYYGGTGITAKANSMGWASRFFHSPVWPF